MLAFHNLKPKLNTSYKRCSHLVYNNVSNRIISRGGNMWEKENLRWRRQKKKQRQWNMLFSSLIAFLPKDTIRVTYIWSYGGYVKITVTFRNFTKVTLCSFCLIMTSHHDSDILNVIPNIWSIDYSTKMIVVDILGMHHKIKI